MITEDTAEWLNKSRKGPPVLVYRGTNVYGTLFDESYFKLLETMLRMEQTSPDKLPLPIRLRKETVERWREENEAHKIELTQTIQNEIGYLMVPILRRTPREDQLFSSNFTSGGIPIAPEKMLDTHMAVDLIGDATFDVYDIAVIVSEDSDFVPAVDFVQEMRHKQVIHVGFGSHMNDLRAKCRHRIDLGKDRAFRRMQRAKPAAEGGGADEDGLADRQPARRPTLISSARTAGGARARRRPEEGEDQHHQRHRQQSRTPSPARATNTATPHSIASRCSSSAISLDCEWRRSMPRRLPGIGCQRLSSAVERAAAAANSATSSATGGETRARPSSGRRQDDQDGHADRRDLGRSPPRRG